MSVRRWLFAAVVVAAIYWGPDLYAWAADLNWSQIGSLVVLLAAFVVSWSHAKD